MSIELNWETLTGGPDGAALAESIRDFIHAKFQTVPLPRFIKSVKVHEFAFGNIPPDVVLKDICDPLPDFYAEDAGDEEDDEDDDEAGDGEAGGADASSHGHSRNPSAEEFIPDSIRAAERRRRAEQSRRFGIGGSGSGSGSGIGSTPPPPQPNSNLPPGAATMTTTTAANGTEFPFPPQPHIHAAGLRSGLATPAEFGSAPFLGLTPGIPGGTSNMHYLQSKLVAPAGWSGTQTPLAAVAGAQHLGGWLDTTGHSHHHHHHHRHHHPHHHNVHLRPSWPPEMRRTSSSAAGQRGGHRRGSSQGSISGADFPPPVSPASPSSLAPPGQQHPPLREKHSVSTLAPTSTGASRPPTRDKPSGSLLGFSGSKAAIDANAAAAAAASAERQKARRGQQAASAAAAAAAGEEEVVAVDDDEDDGDDGEEGEDSPRRYREPRPEDLQAVFRIRYAGDVRLMLTAEILLDYPMPSFVGIPVKLNITGLTFDGVGVLAYIRKRVHFCFLSPEDAAAAVGGDDDDDDDDDGDDDSEDGGDGDDIGGFSRPSTGAGAGAGAGGGGDRGRGRGRDNDRPGVGKGGAAKARERSKKGRVGGLLQEIKVESEIGQREGTKQSLKNVGKVERFVLEQVRRIFEEEFVYPSFWTFLV